ncbi:MAG: hypothetical protein ACFFD4_30650 [Candidatus Odinarchaeota archaeon]
MIESDNGQLNGKKDEQVINIIWSVSSSYKDDHLHPQGPSIQWLEISPRDFLLLAGPFIKGFHRLDARNKVPSTLDYYDNMVKNGLPLEKPMLWINTETREVISHEGRQRSFFCIEKGIKKMPVGIVHQYIRPSDEMPFLMRGKDLILVKSLDELVPEKERG